MTEVKKKAPKIILTHTQMIQVAEYMITNRAVTLLPEHKYVFRLYKNKIVEELIEELKFTVKISHLDGCMQRYFENYKYFNGKEIFVPPPQESMQEDMLKIEIKKLEGEKEKIITENMELKQKLNTANLAISALKGYLDRVQNNIFSVYSDARKYWGEK